MNNDNAEHYIFIIYTKGNRRKRLMPLYYRDKSANLTNDILSATRFPSFAAAEKELEQVNTLFDRQLKVKAVPVKFKESSESEQ